MVSRIAKVVGLVAGAAAVIWAMRDRFISVATSREPEPPTFRMSSSAARTDLDVSVIEGIGPVFAGRLRAAGLATLHRLSEASTDAVAEAAGVSTARARSWIDKAKTLV